MSGKYKECKYCGERDGALIRTPKAGYVLIIKGALNASSPNHRLRTSG